jgi:hypothetical protein
MPSHGEIAFANSSVYLKARIAEIEHNLPDHDEGPFRDKYLTELATLKAELERRQGRWVCAQCGGPRDQCSKGQHGWPFVFCYNCRANVELKWVKIS